MIIRSPSTRYTDDAIGLVFAYVHQYRNIRQQSFNLSSVVNIDFTAKIESDKITDRPLLSISPITDRIEDLFHRNIIDVKAILGENGAGKSTLLNYLAFYASGHPNFMEYGQNNCWDILIFLRKRVGHESEFIVYASEQWRLVEEDIENSFDGSRVSLHEIKEFSWDEIHLPLDVVYYSNVFDNEHEESYSISNISTNYLIRKDLQTIVNDPHGTHGRDFMMHRLSEVGAHSIMEDSRRISFFLSYKDLLPFTRRDHRIMVYFSDAPRRGLIRIDDNPTSVKGIVSAAQIFKVLRRWLELLDSQEIKAEKDPRRIFYRHYFNYLIYTHILQTSDIMQRTYIGLDDYKEQVFNTLLDLMKSADLRAGLDGLIDYASGLELAVNKKAGGGLGDSALSYHLKAFKVLDGLMEPVYREGFFGTGFYALADQHLKDIHDQYCNTVWMDEYMNFTFQDLSSGELGMLTLFSRFYALVDSNSRGISKAEQNKLLVLIDEGDLYFHPKWQVQFLDFIDRFLPTILPGKLIQLIITSHSPFIASDMPSNHLLSIRKGRRDERSPVTGAEAEHKTFVIPTLNKSFGANIHELLSDNFFLEGAHIGLLAKKVIYKLLDQLEGEKVNDPISEQQIPVVIDQIGEGWIRSRLQEKYEIYLNNNHTEI
ncbi:AAA family ATPase [Pedobacter sp. AJM]|uniref:AAA family ATPase n=1 Tax=Pedobacter sp. AJM TaxID=2003629 RepID=UPI000B4B60C3|nr:AAA family ATPase [Pedobacter sp. AJM]OWK70320.1 hypothetical protein CBW18_12730 [Pedobacter sp. AJM]